MSRPRYAFATLLRSDPLVEKQEQTFAAVYAPSAHPPIPANFDGRIVWKDFLSPIKNQGQCGACYAFSVGGALADRYALQTLGQVKPDLSPMDFAICMKNITDPAEFARSRTDPEFEKSVVTKQTIEACKGNTMYAAARATFVQGMFEEKCVSPQTIDNFVAKNGRLPSCTELEGVEVPSVCTDKTPPRYWMTDQYYTIGNNTLSEETVREIKLEVMKWGPVAAGFQVFDDFLTDYTDGTKVYTHPKKEQKTIGGHAVRIVGWGEDTIDGRLVKYWIVANSWGREWGDDGYGKMEIMIPEIQLEKNLVSVWPQILGSNFPYPLSSSDLVPRASKEDSEIKAQLPIDPITMFRKEHVSKIKLGEIVGSLSPVIDPTLIPHYNKFWAFQIGSVQFEIRNGNKVYSFVSGSSGMSGWRKLAIVSIVVLAVVALYILYKKRQRIAT